MAEELNEERYSAYVVSAFDGLSKLMEYTDTMIIRCDSTRDRRSRASAIVALKRAVEAHYGVKLTRFTVSYSETYGFLPRTEIRYKVSKR